MKRLLTLIGIVIVGLLILLNLVFFTVRQDQQAIVLQLGKPMKVIKEPGLNVRLPLIQEVLYFEKKLLMYDAAPAEILTQDKKNLVVDNYSEWKIIDPLKFYQTVQTISGAQSRVDDIVYSELRVELGVHSLLEILSGGRAKLMNSITEKSDKAAREYGIEVVDVRIKRADLPPENEKAVYGRMQAERERQAKKYRSEGQEEAQKIRSIADKDRAIILAEAYREAQEIKGKGDAEAIRVYAEAFQKDPEFYRFTRSLEAYSKSMNKDATLVLTPENEFLDYLQGVKGPSK